jgi:hypothetical protein
MDSPRRSDFTIPGPDDCLDRWDHRLSCGFYLQYWVAAIDYPINIGGRPFNSWPSFIPVTFELTILIASLFAFFGVLALNRLPMPYHPVFNVERFELASRNRFFLCIEAVDSKFEIERTGASSMRLAPWEPMKSSPEKMQALHRSNSSIRCCLMVICLGLVGCQQKMADQPRYEPLQKSDLFDDQRASRPLVEGTVPREQLNADDEFYTGK